MASRIATVTVAGAQVVDLGVGLLDVLLIITAGRRVNSPCVAPMTEERRLNGVYNLSISRPMRALSM
jgi:hypothetical protein